MTAILLTIYAGFTHALETDHLLAVSSIVTKRTRIKHAVKDGIYWGLGHTSTILLIGMLMLVVRWQIEPATFAWFEAAVGLALILLASYRLYRFFRSDADHQKIHTHHHKAASSDNFTLAYSVGLIHGLAGSGALVVLVMAQTSSPLDGMIYLLIFGLGSIVGMLVAAGLFSIPFSRRYLFAPRLQGVLVILSALLCYYYGGKLIFEQVMA